MTRTERNRLAFLTAIPAAAMKLPGPGRPHPERVICQETMRRR
jgi:hypothetical protein